MKVIVTGDDGTVTTNLLEGEYDVHVLYAGYVAGTAHVTVTRGSLTEITVYLDRYNDGARDPRLNISGTPRSARLNIGG